MNGAESLVRTLVNGGVDVCFTNPGTSEMHFVAALDSETGMRCVLALFEGVATGAADGFFRMSRRPAATLLHLGPGLANGLANLHNAKKAGSAIVNIVGDHSISHLAFDAPLASDIAGLARSVSHWVRSAHSASEVGRDGAEAIANAGMAPGQIATLILPGDVAWSQGGAVVETPSVSHRAAVSESAIDAAAAALRGGSTTLLLLGGGAIDEAALVEAGRIAEKTGCGLLTEWSNARFDRGAGRLTVNPIPYVVENAIDALKGYETVVLAGSRRPVAFFGYPNKPSVLTQSGTRFVQLATKAEDLNGALVALSQAVNAVAGPPVGLSKLHRPEIPSGPITPAGVAAVLGARLPEGAIVVDESISSGRDLYSLTAGAPPHTWLNNCGGSIGFGLPVAIGAALACPSRKVVALVGDGSAMYTVQALWTMAREALDVAVLIFANHSYRILFDELTNIGVTNPGVRALNMLSLERPALGWVEIAQGMGVAANRASTCEALLKSLEDTLESTGPTLLEIDL